MTYKPGYQSMGAYYVQNDIERITVAPTLRLFKNRLQFRASAGWQHATRPTKSAPAPTD